MWKGVLQKQLKNPHDLALRINSRGSPYKKWICPKVCGKADNLPFLSLTCITYMIYSSTPQIPNCTWFLRGFPPSVCR